MNVQKKIFKRTLSLLLSFMLVFTALFSTTSFANSSLNSATTQKTMATSVKSGNYIYCCSGTGVYKVNIKTKKKTRLYKTKSPLISWVSDVCVYKGYVYFIAGTSGLDDCVTSIFRIKTNGTHLKNLGTGCNVILYGNKIYYVKILGDYDYGGYYTKGIYKMNLNGSNKTCIKSSSSISQFKIYKSYIYYVYPAYSSHDSIYRISTSGQNNTKLTISTHNDTSYSTDLCDVYRGYVYFTSNKHFFKYNISTKKLTNFRNSTGKMIGIDNGYLYYFYSKHVYKLGLSSNRKYTVVSGITGANSVSSGYLTYYSYFVHNYSSGYRYYLIKTNGTNKVYLGKSLIQ